MQINTEKFFEELSKIIEEDALISKGADYYHGMQDLMSKIRERMRSQNTEPDVADKTFCKKYCKGYQETGKCISDDKCKAYKEYEDIVKLAQEWRNTNCPNAPSVVAAYIAGAMMQKEKDKDDTQSLIEKAWAEGYGRGKDKMKKQIIEMLSKEDK